MAYKHRDIVIAWMDGETIQHKTDSGKWEDRRPFESLLYTPSLGLPSEDFEYRIKPKPVMIRHAAVSAPEGKVVVVYTKNYNKAEDKYSAEVEDYTDIVWLDDWHEASFSAPEV